MLRLWGLLKFGRVFCIKRWLWANGRMLWFECKMSPTGWCFNTWALADGTVFGGCGTFWWWDLADNVGHRWALKSYSLAQGPLCFLIHTTLVKFFPVATALGNSCHHLSHHNELYPFKLWAKINTPSSSRHFITAAGKVTNKSSVWFPTPSIPDRYRNMHSFSPLKLSNS